MSRSYDEPAPAGSSYDWRYLAVTYEPYVTARYRQCELMIALVCRRLTARAFQRAGRGRKCHMFLGCASGPQIKIKGTNEQRRRQVDESRRLMSLRVKFDDKFSFLCFDIQKMKTAERVRAPCLCCAWRWLLLLSPVLSSEVSDDKCEPSLPWAGSSCQES